MRETVRNHALIMSCAGVDSGLCRNYLKTEASETSQSQYKKILKAILAYLFIFYNEILMLTLKTAI